MSLSHSALILKRNVNEAGARWRALLVLNLSIFLAASCPFEPTLISGSSHLPSTSSPQAVASGFSPYIQLCDYGQRLPMLKGDSRLPGARCPRLLCHSSIRFLLHTSELQSTAQILTKLLSNFLSILPHKLPRLLPRDDLFGLVLSLNCSFLAY